MDDAVYEAKIDEKDAVKLFLYRNETEESDAGVPQMDLHFHSAVEFVLVESGKYRAWVNGDTFTLSHGDLLFVEKNLPHAYENLGGAVVHCVDVADSLFEALHLPRKLPRVIRGDNKCNRLYRLINEAHKLWGAASEQYKIGFVYSWLGLILRLFPLEALDSNRRDERFADVLRYIEEHFREQISLDDLTERFGYSKSYFSRTFNRVTGVNLREFLNRRRIAEALKIKAENPSMPWVHITVGVGFESWSTFARAYKRYGGDDLTE